MQSETVLPIGFDPATDEEVAYAAKYVSRPFTPMDQPTIGAARAVFELLLQMAAGDMEAAAEFQRLAEGPSPWEELRG